MFVSVRVDVSEGDHLTSYSIMCSCVRVDVVREYHLTS